MYLKVCWSILILQSIDPIANTKVFSCRLFSSETTSISCPLSAPTQDEHYFSSRCPFFGAPGPKPRGSGGEPPQKKHLPTLSTAPDCFLCNWQLTFSNRWLLTSSIDYPQESRHPCNPDRWILSPSIWEKFESSCVSCASFPLTQPQLPSFSMIDNQGTSAYATR